MIEAGGFRSMKTTIAMRSGLQRTVAQIATSLNHWSKGSVSISGREWVALSGLDQSNGTVDLDDLFWIWAPDHISLSRCAKVDPMSFDIIDSGTLRNSFYPELFMRHSNLVRTGITFRVAGRENGGEKVDHGSGGMSPLRAA